jgi:uncharacterized protein YbaR (Trm112 family)
MSQALTELLACPVCRGELAGGDAGLVCVSCGHSYPVRDGVPNLLLAQPPISEQRPPGLAGRTLQSIVAMPFVYDRVQRLAGAQPLFRRIDPVLADAEGALVLDVGAGTGSIAARLPPSTRYIWLDADPQKLAGFRAKSEGLAILGDATTIPLADRSVDWALSIGVSHHLDDDRLGRMLDELRRVARHRIFFLDAVVTPARTSRLLWRYDRGRHPRTADILRSELAARFEILTADEFTIRHRYLLVTGR